MVISRRDRDKKKAKKTSALDWAKQQAQKGSKCLKLPSDTSFLKLEVGVHDIDFMPFIAGKGNPRADEGFQHFEREYEAHRIPMPDGSNEMVVCNWKTFRTKCAVCEFMTSPAASADKELVKDLRAKVRHIWLVNDKPGDKKNALKVLDTNHYNRGQGFGEMIADALTTNPKYADFADLEGGMTLRLKVKELSGGSFNYNAVVRIDFLKRDYTYPESMLEGAPCLDGMLVEANYKELKKLLNQGGKDDEEEENGEAPRSSKDPKAKREDEDEEEESEDEEELDDDEDEPDEDDGEDEVPAKAKKGKEPTAKSKGLKLGDKVVYTPDDGDQVEATIKKISGDGTSLTLEDEDGDTIRAVAPADVEKADDEEEEDEEDEEPEEEDEDEPEEEEDSDDDEELDDDEDEDETPPAKKKGRR